MAVLPPINFKNWINENRHRLKPPVGNQVVYKDNKEFIVMVVGGPNSRKDYHYNEGEEFFFQLEGTIKVKIIDEGVQRELTLNEGDIFLLPPRTPHSPQRGADSIGLVMERHRAESELDGFMWFCEKCHSKMYEEFIPVSDIVAQLPQVFDRYYSSLEHRTCKKCGSVMEPPPQL